MIVMLDSTIIMTVVSYNWVHCQWYIDSICSTETLAKEWVGVDWRKSMCCAENMMLVTWMTESNN